MQQHNERALHCLGVLAAARDDRAPRAARIVIDGPQVLCHEAGHLQLFADEAAFRQPKIILAPFDVARRPCFSAQHRSTEPPPTALFWAPRSCVSARSLLWRAHSVLA